MLWGLSLGGFISWLACGRFGRSATAAAQRHADAPVQRIVEQPADTSASGSTQMAMITALEKDSVRLTSLRSRVQALERCEAGYKEALAARDAELDALRLRTTAQDAFDSRGQRSPRCKYAAWFS